MSILERIRNRSGLAIIVVGGALALFVISDALQSNSHLFGGDATSVGEIAGDKIDIKMYDAKVTENENNYKQRQNGGAIDQNTSEQIREQTWTQMVQEAILDKQYKDLGIEVTNDELFDLVQGDNPHEQIKSAPIFQNKQTGMFDRTLVIRFLKQLQESDDNQAQTQWVQFEEGLAKETLVKKYNSLVKKGIYTTNFEAKQKYTERMRNLDYEMVAVNYFTIPDSAIKVEDDALKSYFNKNSDKYKEKTNGRKMDFVLFDVLPTAEDTANIQKWVADQVSQFASATNDTLYVDVNSESKFDTMAHPVSFYPTEVADQLFNSPIGTIVGPVFKDGKFHIYKVSGIQTDSMYNMRASHILFKTEGATKEDTLNSLKKATEVLAEIKKGADFAEKASQYGTDGTSARGGDLGWFREGAMVKEFGDWVKAHNKGDIGIVKTQFGIHIVKVTGDKSKKTVCAGNVERTVTPSDKTAGIVYNQANQFAVAISDKGDFDKIIADQGLTKRTADNIKETDRQLAGYPEAREVVRWAFNAKVDDVSEVFTVGDKYVVAKLTGIKEKDKADFESVKERVKQDYIKEQKAEQLLAKAKTASEGAPNLAAIATKLQSTVVPGTAQNFENGNIPYVGPDNTFVGTLFGSKAGSKILGPVKGDNAIYVYTITKYNEAPVVTEYSAQRNEMQNQVSQRFEYGSMEALKDLYKVKDNRFKFY